MIEAQIERLSMKEQRVLEAASVAGVSFSASVIAHGRLMILTIHCSKVAEGVIAGAKTATAPLGPLPRVMNWRGD